MMKMKDERTGFWEPGSSIFHGELAKEEHDRLAPLMAELKDATDPNLKAVVRQNIAAVKKEFQTKRRNAKYCLFAKT
jgi:hypothetical protein